MMLKLIIQMAGTKVHSQNKKIPLKANTIIIEQTMSNPSAPNVHWQQNENHCCSLGVSRFRRPPEPAVHLKLSQNVTLSHQRINGVKSLPLAAIFISEAVKFALCHVMPMLWQQHSKDSNSSSHKHRSVPLLHTGLSYPDHLTNVPTGVSTRNKTTKQNFWRSHMIQNSLHE